MGNQQAAQKIASSPTGIKIGKILNLTLKNQTSTPSLIYSEYANELANSQNSILSRERNPICPMSIKTSQNWMACCFISPLMAVASPIYLFTKYSQFDSHAEVLTVFGGQIRKIPIRTAILIQQQSLCVVVIEKPLFSLGWAGLSFVSSQEQILSLDLRIVAHPQRVLNKETNQMVHVQKARKIRIIRLTDISEEFTYRNEGIMGATVLKIVEGKPYVVGIQNTQHEILFFTEKIFKNMQSLVRSYVSKNGGEKQILKDSNLQQLYQPAIYP